VSEVANARLSELLRDAFALARKGVVTLLSGLAHHDRVDRRESKVPVTSPARVWWRSSAGPSAFGLPWAGCQNV